MSSGVGGGTVRRSKCGGCGGRRLDHSKKEVQQQSRNSFCCGGRRTIDSP